MTTTSKFDVKKIPHYAGYVAVMLEVYGYEAYFVGGCIRDILLEREPKDFDIATNATPEQVTTVFEELQKPVVPTGIKHGTVTVVIENKNVEVTTFRTESKYSDGRHPDEVQFVSTLVEDLARRDFTVNAMAVDTMGNIIDPFNGRQDLEAGLIHPVGDAGVRFGEDALRMLRAIRFSCQLNFQVAFSIFTATRNLAHLIENVSNERIRDELCKILMSDNAGDGFEYLYESGLLNRIMPELALCHGFDQRNPHHYLDVFRHIMAVVEGTPKDLATRLGALFHDIAKPQTFTLDENGIGHFYNHHMVGMDMTKETMKRLKFDNDTIDKVSILVREHMNRGEFSKKVMKKMIARVGVNLMENLFDLQISDLAGHVQLEKYESLTDEVKHMREVMHEILDAKEPFSVKDLAINGRDLIELGFKPSPLMGDILNEILDWVISNPDMNNKYDLVGFTNIMWGHLIENDII